MLLMTAVVEAVGRRKVATRVFLDPGAQASFVSTALVDAMEARQLGTADITLQGFGAQPQTTRMNVRQLQLIGTDGRLHDIEAFERKNLNITISRVPPEIVQRWGECGVYISDCCGATTDTGPEVHVLLGADCVNRFLHEKKPSPW